MQGKKTLSVNLPVDLHIRLKKLAQKTETTITEIVIAGILKELSLRSQEKTKDDDEISLPPPGCVNIREAFINHP